MIFSIGTSNRSLPEFLRELDRRKITCIVDVRSSPWSRNAPFCAPAIERWSERHGVLYRREGEILGGRSELPLDDPRYTDRLGAIISAACREPVAIFCAEGDPADCHRSWDIGASLLVRYGVIVRGILRDGREEDITDTLARVNPSSFRDEIRPALSRQINFFSPNLL